MNWSRAVGIAAAGLVLCGCADSASTSAHGAPNAASTPATAPRRPVLILNGQLDARPGELVAMLLDGVSRAQGHDAVTAQSPAFGAPVRLRWKDGAYGAVATLAMTDKPGWYPLSVAITGQTVARDRIHVVPSERPSFTVTVPSSVARPGGPVALRFDDLYPGEQGTDFTVRSSALPRPARLVRDKLFDFYNPRAYSVQPELKSDLADGTYTFELYGPHGHRIAEQRLAVRASWPGDPDYLGKAYGPDFNEPRRYPDSGHGHDVRVRLGGKVVVWWHDVYPDPGEETRLTATSPAFTQVLHLKRDDTKSADGDDPRYFNTATIRAGLKPGRYPVTVVAHHGRVKKTGYLTVTAR